MAGLGQDAVAENANTVPVVIQLGGHHILSHEKNLFPRYITSYAFHVVQPENHNDVNNYLLQI